MSGVRRSATPSEEKDALGRVRPEGEGRGAANEFLKLCIRSGECSRMTGRFRLAVRAASAPRNRLSQAPALVLESTRALVQGGYSQTKVRIFRFVACDWECRGEEHMLQRAHGVVVDRHDHQNDLLRGLCLDVAGVKHLQRGGPKAVQ